MKRKALFAFITAVICVAAASCSVNVPGLGDKTGDTEVSLPEAVTETTYMEPVTEAAAEVTTEAVTEEVEETEEAVTEPAEEEVTAESLIDNVDYFAHKYDISKGTISETCSVTVNFEGQTYDCMIYTNYSYREYDETTHVSGTISSDLDSETVYTEVWSKYVRGQP